MRVALGIEYDGSGFYGWQRQKIDTPLRAFATGGRVDKGLHTVQSYVERALSRVANQMVTVICAGRTDTAVHALEQVIHFDAPVERALNSWVMGANANLPQGISVLWAKAVSDDFHARFSAAQRRYRYTIFNRAVRPSILASRVSWYYQALDVDKMCEAAQYLLGRHDFTSYRAQACQAKSPVRELTQLSIKRDGLLINIDVQADAFLYHMVRNIAGVLIEIGSGKQEPVWAKTVLEAKDRCQGGVTATPQGLYFVGVDYAAEFDLPQGELSPFVG